jgi:hypothetical protein
MSEAIISGVCRRGSLELMRLRGGGLVAAAMENLRGSRYASSGVDGSREQEAF